MFTVCQSVNCETNRKPQVMWPALKRREKEDRAELITATYDVTEDYGEIEKHRDFTANERKWWLWKSSLIYVNGHVC